MQESIMIKPMYILMFIPFGNSDIMIKPMSTSPSSAAITIIVVILLLLLLIIIMLIIMLIIVNTECA